MRGVVHTAYVHHSDSVSICSLLWFPSLSFYTELSALYCLSFCSLIRYFRLAFALRDACLVIYFIRLLCYVFNPFVLTQLNLVVRSGGESGLSLAFHKLLVCESFLPVFARSQILMILQDTILIAVFIEQ